MVDGVCLVVDGEEGVMSQTKYVVERAVRAGLSPLLLLNKLDRGMEAVKSGQVESDVFDLFCALGATDEQMEYPTYYASAKGGWVTDDLDRAEAVMKGGSMEGLGMDNLLDAFLEHFPPPAAPANGEESFAMAATMVGYDKFLGRTVTGLVSSGSAALGDKAIFLPRDPASASTDKKATAPTPLSGVFVYEGVTRAPLPGGVAAAGQIVTLSGVPDGVKVGDTITRLDDPVSAAVETPPLAPPTLSMGFGANDSPLAGREGTIVQASRIASRLRQEVDNNVTLSVGEGEEGSESSVVYARGELQLGILIEEMRREGYEMSVSPPRIVLDEREDGVYEPWEEVTVDVDSEHSGTVMNMLTGDRKATMTESQEVRS